MNRVSKEDVVSIAGVILTGIGALGSAIGAWYAREATKRRGRHRRR